MAMAGRLMAFVQDNIIWLLILGILLIVAFMAHQQAVEAERLKGQLREFNVTLTSARPAQFFVGISDPDFGNVRAVPILYRPGAREIYYKEDNTFTLDSTGKGSKDATFETDLNPGELAVVGVWTRTACIDAQVPTNSFQRLLQECAQTFLGARSIVVG